MIGGSSSTKNVPRVLDVDLVHTLVRERRLLRPLQRRRQVRRDRLQLRSAQIFDVNTGDKLCVLQDENIDLTGDLYIRSVCFSPDGKYLAPEQRISLSGYETFDANRSRRGRANMDGTCRFGTSSQGPSETPSPATSRISTLLDFSRDGRTIASGRWGPHRETLGY